MEVAFHGTRLELPYAQVRREVVLRLVYDVDLWLVGEELKSGQLHEVNSQNDGSFARCAAQLLSS